MASIGFTHLHFKLINQLLSPDFFCVRFYLHGLCINALQCNFHSCFIPGCSLIQAVYHFCMSLIQAPCLKGFQGISHTCLPLCTLACTKGLPRLFHSAIFFSHTRHFSLYRLFIILFPLPALIFCLLLLLFCLFV